MKIVVCDDSKAMRMIVMRMLKQTEFADAEFVQAEDGAQGLAAVREHEPDLIVSDWNMPNMSGIEFLQALRAEGNTTTFGFVTSETTPDMREVAIINGASFTIAKPFTAETFTSVLSGALS
ncbi:Chemotaxis regulator - transmits chemoreceptor signals to flagelllar motor components CheY [Euzebya pacifica]|uniref:Chemotaxis regulator-transmits chemoreceptor signals to flagelllar motor components CheY n=1 Tax=Euzebya pacifica TaxID=1608957 RepID=A0A346XT58_9ACTN|nr:response regulator [Euzebya pacifica]AXV05405.1 Chemotaxis regulator - transmits chemoreceptor signals to flagelllar motor components CheY [Euzebya pacifica]